MSRNLENSNNNHGIAASIEILRRNYRSDTKTPISPDKLLRALLYHQPPAEIVRSILRLDPYATHTHNPNRYTNREGATASVSSGTSAKNPGLTALQIAIQNFASLDVIEELIQANPYSLFVGNGKFDPLTYAQIWRSNDLELLELLEHSVQLWNVFEDSDEDDIETQDDFNFDGDGASFATSQQDSVDCELEYKLEDHFQVATKWIHTESSSPQEESKIAEYDRDHMYEHQLMDGSSCGDSTPIISNHHSAHSNLESRRINVTLQAMEFIKQSILLKVQQKQCRSDPKPIPEKSINEPSPDYFEDSFSSEERPQIPLFIDIVITTKNSKSERSGTPMNTRFPSDNNKFWETKGWVQFFNSPNSFVANKSHFSFEDESKSSLEYSFQDDGSHFYEQQSPYTSVDVSNQLTHNDIAAFSSNGGMDQDVIANWQEPTAATGSSVLWSPLHDQKSKPEQKEEDFFQIDSTYNKRNDVTPICKEKCDCTQSQNKKSSRFRKFFKVFPRGKLEPKKNQIESV